MTSFGDRPVDLQHVRDTLRDFARERDWEQFHTPRNLLLALTGEVGELVEIAQWRTDEELTSYAAGPDGERRIGDELADVLSYLVQVADSLDIDLGAAWQRKMGVNAEKYPAELVRGSNRKHDEYPARPGHRRADG